MFFFRTRNPQSKKLHAKSFLIANVFDPLCGRNFAAFFFFWSNYGFLHLFVGENTQAWPGSGSLCMGAALVLVSGAELLQTGSACQSMVGLTKTYYVLLYTGRNEDDGESDDYSITLDPKLTP